MRLNLIKFSDEQEWHRYTVVYTRYVTLFLSVLALVIVCYLPQNVREMSFAGDGILFEVSGYTCNPTTYRMRGVEPEGCPRFWDSRIKRGFKAAGAAFKAPKQQNKGRK